MWPRRCPVPTRAGRESWDLMSRADLSMCSLSAPRPHTSPLPAEQQEDRVNFSEGSWGPCRGKALPTAPGPAPEEGDRAGATHRKDREPLHRQRPRADTPGPIMWRGAVVLPGDCNSNSGAPSTLLFLDFFSWAPPCSPMWTSLFQSRISPSDGHKGGHSSFLCTAPTWLRCPQSPTCLLPPAISLGCPSPCPANLGTSGTITLSSLTTTSFCPNSCQHRAGNQYMCAK